MGELLLGIDIGTTNVKAVLATPEGQVVASTHDQAGPNRIRQIGGIAL